MTIGIICSKQKGEIYCIENSHYHKNNLNIKNIDILYIPSYCLNKLVTKEPNITKWNLKDIINLSSPL